MAAPEETCAALVVRELVHCGGVCVCFANPGTTEMHIVAALEKQAQQQQPGMRSILCLHEAVATGAADGYARINSSPALVLLHLGPGLGNGLCNLHNAHRARSPVIVLVGEHATWHQAADPVLAQDIQALAATVSGAVLTIASPAQAASSVHAALALASTSGGNSSLLSSDGDKAAATTADVKPGSCPASKVVTLVLPHDVSWTPPPPLPAAPAATESHLRCLPRQLRLSESPAGWQFLADCAAALRAAPRGKAALLLGGAALLNDGVCASAGCCSRCGSLGREANGACTHPRLRFTAATCSHAHTQQVTR
jgi:acetolactate synthase-1/2/3 large subunit